MSDPLYQVIASFHRCRDDDQFLDTFYDLFLAKSSEIAERFAQTDFEIQKRMLRESLLQVLCVEQRIPGSREEVVRLGRRHRELRITPEMYDMWVESLCEAIARHDPMCTDDLRASWRSAVQPAIDLMISMLD
jgi:hemoglobin-like flavoprotein